MVSRLASKSRKDTENKTNYAAYSAIDSTDVVERAQQLAAHLRKNKNKIIDILLNYETLEVATDELDRTFDLLENLNENREYFHTRVGEVTSFLPRNQPLYALACFVIVPSYMATEVHFRIPQTMRHFMPNLIRCLKPSKYFQNVKISSLERLDFLRERSASLLNPETSQSRPVTDVVIFTGSPKHSVDLRKVFSKETLFIANGAGHNPVVVTPTADIKKAATAVLKLQLYNQGQDCAAPNSILVHNKVHKAFLKELKVGLRTVKIGAYRERGVQVGPISSPRELPVIAQALVRYRKWLDDDFAGNIRVRDSIIEPAIVNLPLAAEPNFSETFAPILFIQKYDSDSELSIYFNNKEYAQHAMYVTVYGKSKYVDSLLTRPIAGKILHDSSTIIRNKHLHERGVERGVKPYGGYGLFASSYSLNGKVSTIPTLPQRDIFEQLVLPLLDSGKINNISDQYHKYTDISYKNVRKLLRLCSDSQQKDVSMAMNSSFKYVDSKFLQTESARYVRVNSKNYYTLLESMNNEYALKLSHEDTIHIRNFRALVKESLNYSLEELSLQIYNIAKRGTLNVDENKKRQLKLFRHVYNLILGIDKGPRLAQFIKDADKSKICELLDV